MGLSDLAGFHGSCIGLQNAKIDASKKYFRTNGALLSGIFNNYLFF
jgi:hypothetical protein